MRRKPMALNLDIIGKQLESEPFTYTEDQVILYALGIGAGVKELDFVYEKSLKVLPTFAVIPFMPTLLNVFVPQSGLNLFKVLHGEHQIVLHKPIPSSGTVNTTTICDSVYDKGDKGALVNVRFETRDEAGDLVFENRAVIVDRSAGNFGGDRGPKTEPITPPEGREPDFRVSHTVPVDQVALYRLSGDKNPLHIDPAFAKKGGFDRPILHGLCTVGYAGRAILHSVCGSDPNRLKSFSLRFVNVVYPGDTLITEGWKSDDNQYIIQTINQDGKQILGNAIAAVQ
jgi:acyl dehydratase